LFYEVLDLGPGFSGTRKFTSYSSVKSSVMEPEPGAAEPKFNSLLELEPKLRIAAPALASAPALTPFYLSHSKRNFLDKNHIR
jgi:hypothetical protein